MTILVSQMKDNSEDNYILGYLGNSYFTVAESGDPELQPDEELADNEVEWVEIGKCEVEKSAVNEGDVIDEARLPVIVQMINYVTMLMVCRIEYRSQLLLKVKCRY